MMRLEISVENEKPQIFSFNQERLILGSADFCDIKLSATGISRNHLALLNENGRYFVIDQGSTNGSYINDKQLIAGVKVEFTTYFPIRLGSKVVLTLMSDAADSSEQFTSKIRPITKIQNSDDFTRAINLKELKSIKTGAIQKKQLQQASDKKRMLLVGLCCFLIFGFSIHYNLRVLTLHKTTIQTTEVKKNLKVTPKVEHQLFPLVALDDLIPKEKYKDLETEVFCSTDVEKYFCNFFPEGDAKVIQLGTTLNLFYEGNSILQEVRALLPIPQEGEDPSKYIKDLHYVSMLWFLSHKFNNELDLQVLGNLSVTFVLRISVATDEHDYITAAFVPESFNKFIQVARPPIFKDVKKYGGGTLYYLKDYMRFHSP